MREAYLRAALMEFASIEEQLPRDLQDLGLSARPFRFCELRDPLVHCIRELRNYEIHLEPKGMTKEHRNVLWGNREDPEAAEPIDMTFWMLSPLTVAEFSKLRNAKLYRTSDVVQLVSWFNDAQSRLGIGGLVYRALLRFFEESAARYSL